MGKVSQGEKDEEDGGIRWLYAQSVDGHDAKPMCPLVLTMVMSCDIAVSEMPSSYITVGSTKVIPKPPMPCVIHIIKNGTNVGFLNIALIWSRSNVLDSMVGAREGRSAMIASFSGSERKAAVSGSSHTIVRTTAPRRCWATGLG